MSGAPMPDGNAAVTWAVRRRASRARRSGVDRLRALDVPVGVLVVAAIIGVEAEWDTALRKWDALHSLAVGAFEAVGLLVFVGREAGCAVEDAARHIGRDRELRLSRPVIVLVGPEHHVVKDIAGAGDADDVRRHRGAVAVADPDAHREERRVAGG